MARTQTRKAGCVFRWATAVDRLGARALDRSKTYADRLVDATLFAVALRNLQRGIRHEMQQMVYEESKQQVDDALAHFDYQVPHAQLVRNALDHMDEYGCGNGDGDGDGDREDGGWPFKIEWDNSAEGVIAVGEDLKLSIAVAREAASKLFLAFEMATI